MSDSRIPDSRVKTSKLKGLPEYISVISSTQVARIRINDIEIIEQEGRRLHIVTADREYAFYESMNEVAKLLGGRAFFRPMRCMIVNLDHIKDINGFYVNFYSGQSISMGKNSISRMRSAFKRYLKKYPPYSLWEPVRTNIGADDMDIGMDIDMDTGIDNERAPGIYTREVLKETRKPIRRSELAEVAERNEKIETTGATEKKKKAKAKDTIEERSGQKPPAEIKAESRVECKYAIDRTDDYYNKKL